MKPPYGNTPGPGPQSFQGSPGYTASRPAPTPARVVGPPVPVAPAPPPKRTHQTQARVTLRLPDRVELNRAAVSALGISAAGLGKPGSPVELITPRRGGGRQWLLDTRPTAAARLSEYRGVYSFRTATAVDTRYLKEAGPVHLTNSIHPTRMAFDLGPELLEQVCVTLPATEFQPARQGCQMRGTGVFQLLPRRS